MLKLLFSLLITTQLSLITSDSSDKLFSGKDSVKAGDKQYSIGLTEVNWYTAQQLCALQGMTLASVMSEAEQNILYNYIQGRDFHKLNKAFWLGATNLGDGFNFFWIANGYPLVYLNWNNQKPNNYNGQQNCIAMHPIGKWNDADCKNTKKYFVCEHRCPIENNKLKLLINMLELLRNSV